VQIDYCIIELILMTLVWKNGSEKNIYALQLTIEVNWAGKTAEECHLVGETLIITYTRHICVYAKCAT